MPVCAHAHAHTHTHAHVRTQTHIHTHMHACTHVHTDTHTHTHTHTHTEACIIPMHMDACVSTLHHTTHIPHHTHTTPQHTHVCTLTLCVCLHASIGTLYNDWLRDGFLFLHSMGMWIFRCLVSTCPWVRSGTTCWLFWSVASCMKLAMRLLPSGNLVCSLYTNTTSGIFVSQTWIPQIFLSYERSPSC